MNSLWSSCSINKAHQLPFRLYQFLKSCFPWYYLYWCVYWCVRTCSLCCSRWFSLLFNFHWPLHKIYVVISH
jgi:hypothetical protein